MARFLLALSVLFSGARAAQLVPDQHGPQLMRRDQAVQLGGSGEIVREAPSMKDNEKEKNDFCNWDYIEGTASTDNCTNEDNHKHILESEMCLEAAKELKLPTLGEFDRPGYRTPTDDFYGRPRGCYKGPCSKPGGQCLFFNEVPMWPKKGNITGTPVCRRARLVIGPNKVDGVAPKSCPEDYGPIMNEKFCEEAADCLGRGTAKEFRIGMRNRTQHDLFPQGCFIHPVENIVYFNPKYPALDGKDWVPGNPSGKPICQIKTPAGGGIVPEEKPVAGGAAGKKEEKGEEKEAEGAEAEADEGEEKATEGEEKGADGGDSKSSI